MLEGCTIELSDDSDGFTFMINFPGPHSRTYYLCADTQEDMESWMKVGIFFSVLRPFQDYFSSYETGQSVGGRKQENPEKNLLAHPQAELGLSHMWSVWGSNPAKYNGKMIE